MINDTLAELVGKFYPIASYHAQIYDEGIGMESRISLAGWMGDEVASRARGRSGRKQRAGFVARITGPVLSPPSS